MFVVGIDPGSTGGAISIINPSTLAIEVVKSLPITTNERTGKKKLDLYILSQLVAQYKDKISIAVIERVHSMPCQGVVSTFSFGFAAGAIHGIFAANKILLHEVDPAVWKSMYRLSREKGESIKKVEEIFGKNPFITKKSDHNKAESLLLAHFAIRVLPHYAGIVAA